MTESARRAIKKYKAKVKRIYLDFSPADADLLAQVEKQPRKQTYIKDLIRKDIASNVD